MLLRDVHLNVACGISVKVTFVLIRITNKETRIYEEIYIIYHDYTKIFMIVLLKAADVGYSSV